MGQASFRLDSVSPGEKGDQAGSGVRERGRDWQGDEAAGTFRMVGEDQEVDTGCACPRPKDGDALGVAPKVGDVLTEPAQGLDLVQEAIVAFRSLVPGAEETCR